MVTSFMRACGLMLGVSLSCASPAASPAADPALGQWLAPEPAEGTTTIVEIYPEGETLAGRVVRIVDSDQRELHRHCDRCPGALRGQALAGMRFLWGLRRDQEQWTDGTVMDLRDGLTQGITATAKLAVHGDTLELRAYRGLPALGQTRTWYRSPDAEKKAVPSQQQQTPDSH